jgi:hypothetical protein
MKCLLILLFFIPNISVAQAKFIAQQLKSSDSTFVNSTSLKVYCLFSTNDTSINSIRFTKPLEGNVKVYGSQRNAFIYTGGISFQIDSNGLYILSKEKMTKRKRLQSTTFGGSKRIQELENGEVEITFDLDKKYIPTQIGEIEVSPQELQCDDTGTNPFNIISEGKEIIFKQGGNLIFFEFDSNNDDNMELYIVNYFSCMKQLEIYKIE